MEEALLGTKVLRGTIPTSMWSSVRNTAVEENASNSSPAVIKKCRFSDNGIVIMRCVWYALSVAILQLAKMTEYYQHKGVSQ